ncbi:MAG: M14 family zinc carboxypeptidase, partial [Woeseia sp.]
MSNLEATYSGLCQVITIGTSHEGRPIKALKISDNVAIDEGDEGDVVFIALHHAREWISVEMALYLAEQLLTRYSTDPQLQADVNNLEIWIIPVANPDGFAH